MHERGGKGCQGCRAVWGGLCGMGPLPSQGTLPHDARGLPPPRRGYRPHPKGLQPLPTGPRAPPGTRCWHCHITWVLLWCCAPPGSSKPLRPNGWCRFWGLPVMPNQVLPPAAVLPDSRCAQGRGTQLDPAQYSLLMDLCTGPGGTALGHAPPVQRHASCAAQVRSGQASRAHFL